jgi:uncharacterized protein YbaA (DUF1428 family)
MARLSSIGEAIDPSIREQLTALRNVARKLPTPGENFSHDDYPLAPLLTDAHHLAEAIDRVFARYADDGDESESDRTSLGGDEPTPATQRQSVPKDDAPFDEDTQLPPPTGRSKKPAAAATKRPARKAPPKSPKAPPKAPEAKKKPAAAPAAAPAKAPAAKPAAKAVPAAQKPAAKKPAAKPAAAVDPEADAAANGVIKMVESMGMDAPDIKVVKKALKRARGDVSEAVSFCMDAINEEQERKDAQEARKRRRTDAAPEG